MSCYHIDQARKVYYRGTECNLGTLRATLIGKDRQTLFFIRADRTMALQPFVDILRECRELGFIRMSLQTEAAR